MADVATTIGPANAGQRMTLCEFARIDGEPGHFYELAKGVIVVVDVPSYEHHEIVDKLNDLLRTFKVTHRGVIHSIGSGSDGCLRLAGMESERHPDVTIYLTPPPDRESPWDSWIPAIVVEVVSESSRHRDYVEKREEYLAAGVMEYWIVDPEKKVLLVLRRRGDVWTEHPVQPDQSYATGLLPGFSLEPSSLFAEK